MQWLLESQWHLGTMALSANQAYNRVCVFCKVDPQTTQHTGVHSVEKEAWSHPKSTWVWQWYGPNYRSNYDRRYWQETSSHGNNRFREKRWKISKNENGKVKIKRQLHVGLTLYKCHGYRFWTFELFINHLKLHWNS